jgi:hypothetical protein
MDKNELKEIFNKILSNNVFPCLKELHYKKQGNNFKYYDKVENFGKIVSFQGSKYSRYIFSINYGVYIPEFEYYHCDIPKISNEKFIEPICAIRKNIGNYNLIENVGNIDISKNIENDIQNCVIPFLQIFSNKKTVFEQLLLEKYFGIYEITRIKTLYKNGFRNEIINLIESENYRKKYKGIVLEKINKWIEENK